MIVQLTEVRKDGMQKWERYNLPKSDHMRYFWLAPYQSVAGVKVGSQAHIEYVKGTGGVTGGHWACYKITSLIDPSKMEM